MIATSTMTNNKKVVVTTAVETTNHMEETKQEEDMDMVAAVTTSSLLSSPRVSFSASVDNQSAMTSSLSTASSGNSTVHRTTIQVSPSSSSTSHKAMSVTAETAVPTVSSSSAAAATTTITTTAMANASASSNATAINGANVAPTNTTSATVSVSSGPSTTEVHRDMEAIKAAARAYAFSSSSSKSNSSCKNKNSTGTTSTSKKRTNKRSRSSTSTSTSTTTTASTSRTGKRKSRTPSIHTTVNVIMVATTSNPNDNNLQPLQQQPSSSPPSYQPITTNKRKGIKRNRSNASSMYNNSIALDSNTTNHSSNNMHNDNREYNRFVQRLLLENHQQQQNAPDSSIGDTTKKRTPCYCSLCRQIGIKNVNSSTCDDNNSSNNKNNSNDDDDDDDEEEFQPNELDDDDDEADEEGEDTPGSIDIKKNTMVTKYHNDNNINSDTMNHPLYHSVSSPQDDITSLLFNKKDVVGTSTDGMGNMNNNNNTNKNENPIQDPWADDHNTNDNLNDDNNNDEDDEDDDDDDEMLITEFGSNLYEELEQELGWLQEEDIDAALTTLLQDNCSVPLVPCGGIVVDVDDDDDGRSNNELEEEPFNNSNIINHHHHNLYDGKYGGIPTWDQVDMSSPLMQEPEPVGSQSLSSLMTIHTMDPIHTNNSTTSKSSTTILPSTTTATAAVAAATATVASSTQGTMNLSPPPVQKAQPLPRIEVTRVQYEQLRKLLQTHYQLLMQQTILAAKATKEQQRGTNRRRRRHSTMTKITDSTLGQQQQQVDSGDGGSKQQKGINSGINIDKEDKTMQHFVGTESADDLIEILDAAVGMLQDLDQNRRDAIRRHVQLQEAATVDSTGRQSHSVTESGHSSVYNTELSEKINTTSSSSSAAATTKQRTCQRPLTRAQFTKTLLEQNQKRQMKRIVFDIAGLSQLNESFHIIDQSENQSEWNILDHKTTNSEACCHVLTSAGTKIQKDLLPGASDLSTCFLDAKEYLDTVVVDPQAASPKKEFLLRKNLNLLTSGEDNLVLRGANLYGERQWILVSDRFLPDRSDDIISKRYAKLCLMMYKANGIQIDENGNLETPPKLDSPEDADPIKVSILKRIEPPHILNVHRWLIEEDLTLLRAVATFGKMWVEIKVRFLPHRDRAHLRKRYEVIERRLKSTAKRIQKDAGNPSSSTQHPEQAQNDKPPTVVSSSASVLQNSTTKKQTSDGNASCPQESSTANSALVSSDPSSTTEVECIVPIIPTCTNVQGIEPTQNSVDVHSTNLSPNHQINKSSRSTLAPLVQNNSKLVPPPYSIHDDTSRAAFEHLAKENTNAEWSQLSQLAVMMEDEVTNTATMIAGAPEAKLPEQATNSDPICATKSMSQDHERSSIRSMSLLESVRGFCTVRAGSGDIMSAVLRTSDNQKQSVLAVIDERQKLCPLPLAPPTPNPPSLLSAADTRETPTKLSPAFFRSNFSNMTPSSAFKSPLGGTLGTFPDGAIGFNVSPPSPKILKSNNSSNSSSHDDCNSTDSFDVRVAMEADMSIPASRPFAAGSTNHLYYEGAHSNSFLMDGGYSGNSSLLENDLEIVSALNSLSQLPRAVVPHNSKKRPPDESYTDRMVQEHQIAPLDHIKRSKQDGTISFFDRVVGGIHAPKLEGNSNKDKKSGSVCQRRINL